MTNREIKNTNDPISKFCIDLTSMAKQGKIGPVIGREDEIRRTMQILSRRTKNNPLLIGEPGTGKTAIAEAIAQKISQKTIPDNLKWNKLISIDMGALVDGTKISGEFENRIKSIISEVIDSNGQILIFIDEVHTLIGTGTVYGTLYAANILKTALSRGQIRCIGATTFKEFKIHIAKDPALERRFQTIFINEPSIQESVQILKGLKNSYEVFHNVYIQDDAMNAAVTLSNRYINDRFLPDKAISLIDDAASIVRMQICSCPIPIENKKKELSSMLVEMQMDSSMKQSNKQKVTQQLIDQKQKELYELEKEWEKEKELISKAKKLKTDIQKLEFDESESERQEQYNQVAQIRYGTLPKAKTDLNKIHKQLKILPNRLVKEEVDEEIIAQIVSKWTHIPVEKILQKEANKLLNLEEKISSKVVGQEQAISDLCHAIRRSRSKISDQSSPVGAFLLIGPTGVGKTELSKVLAEELFGSRESIIRMDMSEYMDKHSSYKLIGDPPGYVGLYQSGQLTEALYKKPYSIVILDKIEKAHTDVLNILLQLLDKGEITDSKGKLINAKNAIFVMTSNIAAIEIIETCRNTDSSIVSKELVSTITGRAINKTFKSELINRLDMLVFLPLSRREINKVTNIQFDNLKKRLSDQGIELVVDSDTIKAISDEGYSFELGARPIKSVFKKKIENMLAVAILEEKIAAGDTVHIETKGDSNIIYHVTKPK